MIASALRRKWRRSRHRDLRASSDDGFGAALQVAAQPLLALARII